MKITNKVFLLAIVISSVAMTALAKTRIVNGDIGIYVDWPFIVSLQSGGDANPFHFCGGTYIGDKWVVTAAHCVTNGEADFKVSIGSGEYTLGEKIQVINVRPHPLYAQNSSNDFALLELASVPSIGAAANILSALEFNQLMAGEILTVAGWGIDNSDSVPDFFSSGRCALCVAGYLQ